MSSSAVSTAVPPPSSPSSNSGTMGNPMGAPTPLCHSFDCTGILLPLLLSTMFSSLLFGGALMAASYTYSTMKHSKGNTTSLRVGIVVLVVWQVVLSSVEIGKMLQVFAANFGNVAGLVQHRPSNTLVPLLGELVQSFAMLLILFRVRQSMQATRWSSFVTATLVVVLALGWTANLVGGIAVCTQIKSLKLSVALSAGSQGGEALARVVLLQLASASFVVTSFSSILVRERLRSAPPRYKKQPKSVLQKAIKVGRNVVGTATCLALCQVSATIFWVLCSQYRSSSNSTWSYGFLAVLPSIYTVTAIAVLSSAPPRPLPRQPRVRKASLKAPSPTDTSASSEYFDRPFLFYSTTADLSPSMIAFGEHLRSPPAPPYSEPGRLRAHSTAPTFRPTHARSRSPPLSPPPKASASFRKAYLSSPPPPSPAPHQSSPLVTSVTTATNPLCSHELVVRPTCVVEADEEEEEKLVVMAAAGKGEKPCSRLGERERKIKVQQDTITERLMEAGRMAVEQGVGEKDRVTEKERRRAVVVVARSEPPRRQLSITSDSSMPSQGCSTPSVRQYDPTTSSSSNPSPPRPSFFEADSSPVDPSFDSPSFSPIVLGSTTRRGKHHRHRSTSTVLPFPPCREVFGTAV